MGAKGIKIARVELPNGCTLLLNLIQKEVNRNRPRRRLEWQVALQLQPFPVYFSERRYEAMRR